MLGKCCQGIVRKKILSGKSCLKLFSVSCIFICCIFICIQVFIRNLFCVNIVYPMDRIYKCTCVCVCLSHLLSTRLQVRLLNGFLQLLALKTWIYARLCLLRVSAMNNHILGSKVSQNPHFGGLNRHFKPNMRKIQIAISSDLCIRLT